MKEANEKLEKKGIKGITLIALVITIIVLLILAGVSIAMLTGNNGILTQAQNAKEKSINAQEDELRRLTAMQAATNLENTIYEDKNRQTAIIPAGFAVSQVEGENIIENGLVIIDSKGNEFVWIPVDGTNLKYEKHTYATPSVDDGYSTEDTGNGNWSTYYYRKYTDWTDNGGNASSVAKYGGFYVARYEAGVPENANFYASEDGDTYYTADTNPSKNVTTFIPVSQKGVQVWNCINQVNALEVASKMYNTAYVKSSIIDGYAWDTITQWLYNSGYNVAYSTSWGNYYKSRFTFNGLYATHIWQDNNTWNIANNYNKREHIMETDETTETATGVSERNKANNIYDFAGNIWEWTTEVGTHNGTNTTFAVRRGGGFNDEEDDRPASIRYGSLSNTSSTLSTGFRVVLYLE